MPFNYDKFLLFGDSITQFASSITRGYCLQPAVQEAYMRKLDVINRGYGGYNSSHGRVILPHVLETEDTEQTKVKIMTIWWGTNDAVDTFQHVDIEKYEKNMDEMIRMAKKRNIAVIVIGPTLHDTYAYTELYKQGVVEFADTAKNSTNKKYSEVAKKVSKANGVPYIDLWSLFLEFGGWEDLQDVDNLNSKDYPKIKELLIDGIHLQPQGYKILFENLQKVIKEFYPDLYFENIPEHLIAWDKIDNNDMENSIFSVERE